MSRKKWPAIIAFGVMMVGGVVFFRASGEISQASVTEPSQPAHTGGSSTPTVSTQLPARHGGAMSSTAPKTGLAHNAPETGDKELFAYSKTTNPHNDGPYTMYPVDIDVDRVLASVLSGHLTFTAPDGSQIALDYDRHMAHGDGNWTWFGRKTGDSAGQDAVITFGPDATYGTLPSSSGQQLRITTLQGQTYITSASFTQLQPGLRAGGDTVVKGAGAAAIGSVSSVVAPATAAASAPVDVAIGYSSSYRAYLGSPSAVNTRLINLVDVANRALSNSSITTSSFRLVASVEVNYDDGTDNGVALSDLASTSPSSPLAAVRAARTQFGADLVSFMRRYATSQNGCGLAYIPQQPYAANAPEQTFSVVGDGSVDLGNGTYSYCPDTSLAHEMGHNLGAQHNKQQNNSGGLYAYSYGYRNDSAQFYDIMAYGLSGQQAQLVYSTPDVASCRGVPCGVANDADVARTLRETMSVAMALRASMSQPPDSSQPGQIIGPTGRCVDAANGWAVNGTPLQIWSCNDFRQQQWNLLVATGAFQNKNLNRVMDVQNYGVVDGAKTQLYEPTGATNQSFYFAHTSLVTNGGRVVDAVGYGSANGTRMQIYDNYNAPNQKWTYYPRTGQIKIDTGRCLDVANYGTLNGTPVQLYDCTGTINQQFKLSANGSLVGYAGKCLDVADSLTTNGAEVRMWDCNGQPNQRWRFRGEIRGEQSGKCLDDPSGGQENGPLLQIYTCLGNTHQQWEFQPN